MFKTAKILFLLSLLTSCVSNDKLMVVKALPNQKDTVSVIDNRKNHVQIKIPELYHLYSDSNFNKPLCTILKEQLQSKQIASDQHLKIKLNQFLVTTNKPGVKRAQSVKGAYDIALNTFLGTIPAAIVSSVFENLDIGTTQYREQADITCTIFIETNDIPVLVTYVARVDYNSIGINIPIAIKKTVSNLSDKLHEIYRT